jgi:hypothetical protein
MVWTDGKESFLIYLCGIMVDVMDERTYNMHGKEVIHSSWLNVSVHMLRNVLLCTCCHPYGTRSNPCSNITFIWPITFSQIQMFVLLSKDIVICKNVVYVIKLNMLVEMNTSCRNSFCSGGPEICKKKGDTVKQRKAITTPTL